MSGSRAQAGKPAPHQAASFTGGESAIRTIIVAAITSNLSLADAPGNFVVDRRTSGLSRKSVVNVSHLLTIDKALLTQRLGRLSGGLAQRFDAGLRLVLSL